MLEGEEEGQRDVRGESPKGLSVITISEDEEGGGTNSLGIQGTSPW